MAKQDEKTKKDEKKDDKKDNKKDDKKENDQKKQQQQKQQNDEHKNDDEKEKDSKVDKNPMKTQYRQVRSDLYEVREKNMQKETPRVKNQPYTYQTLAAYADTSIGDTVMKANTNPVPVKPFGLRPGEAVACECCRDSTIKPVMPHKSHYMDNRYRLCVRHQKEAEENEQEEKDKEQKKEDQKKQDKNTANKKSDPKKNEKTEDDKNANKKSDPKKGDKTDDKNNEKAEDKNKKSNQKSGKNKKNEEENDEENEKEEEEPRHMSMSYRSCRERRVEFKPLDILQKKSKHELNFDDLKIIRKEIQQQRSEKAKERYEENKILTQRDWKEMEFDELYDLRLEADKKRLHFPCTQYLGAFKKGSHDAAVELAEPLNPGAAENPRMKRLDAKIAAVQE